MRKIPLLILLIIFLLNACKNGHFLNDQKYRDRIESLFEEKIRYTGWLNHENTATIYRNLPDDQREAFEFLVASAPLNDLADYDGNFFLEQVKYALMARDNFSWGREIPEEVFRHFVLPYRVNNENLDSSRSVFYKELKPRISNLSIEEAVLEINHWCHEKVNYHPTDIRTSSPLATVRTGFGRCGEESTFTVAALRSVCIPARQVYTPRWAHTDDNHAWVEVYINGVWKYLGACEPAPELNMAWFTAPAKRAMMVHTTVFGPYKGNEDIIRFEKNHSVISTLGNYASTDVVHVFVKDEKGKALKGALVSFCLFNYAEFYPLASFLTDKNGSASLITGKGSLMVEVSQDGLYLDTMINVAETKILNLVLKNTPFRDRSRKLMHVAPGEPSIADENSVFSDDFNKRLRHEDSIRNLYVESFIDREKSDSIAGLCNLDPDTTWVIINKSRGNWPVIVEFLVKNHEDHGQLLFPLLTSLTTKDLRDVELSVLEDHARNAGPGFTGKACPEPVWVRFVLNPRVKNELLKPYRELFRKEFKHFLEWSPEDKISGIRTWMKKELTIEESGFYYNLPASPSGVYHLKISNRESAGIFFVALCRSLDIPARINPRDNAVEYYCDSGWREVDPYKEINPLPSEATLVLENTKGKPWTDPAYGIHFSLSRFESGRFITLDLGAGKRLSSFNHDILADTGYYRFLTANRDPDGNAQINIRYFHLRGGDTRKLKPGIPEPVYYFAGNVNDVQRITFENDRAVTPGNPGILIWFDRLDEPVIHLLNEMETLDYCFNKWNGTITIIVTEDIYNTVYMNYRGISNISNLKFIIDKDISSLIDKSVFTTEIKDPEYPAVIVFNDTGDIKFFSAGYAVGLADMILFSLE